MPREWPWPPALRSIPIAQWGAHRVLAPYGKRPKLFPRKTVRAIVGDPVDLSDLMGREPTAEVLRIATDRIMAAITALLAELRDEVPPKTLVDRHLSGLPDVGDAGIAYDEGVAG